MLLRWHPWSLLGSVGIFPPQQHPLPPQSHRHAPQPSTLSQPRWSSRHAPPPVFPTSITEPTHTCLQQSPAVSLKPEGKRSTNRRSQASFILKVRFYSQGTGFVGVSARCALLCSVASVMSHSLQLHGTVAHKAPLSIGFPRQEYWSGLSMPSFRGSSPPSDRALVACIAGRFFTDWATREAPSARCQSINEMLRRSLCSVRVISLSGTALPQNFLTSSTRSILAPNTAAVKPRMGRLSYEQYIAQQDSWKAPCTAFWGWLSTEHHPLLLCPTDSTLFICSEHCCVLPELSKTTRFCSESGNMS